MAEALGVADAKRRFSELLDRVSRGERFVIHRRGRPAVALVPPGEVDTEAAGGPYLGLAAMAGALADWETIEEDMAEVVRARRRSRDRPAPDLG